MRFRTVHVDLGCPGPDHQAIIIGDDNGVFDDTKKFCGYTHCRGDCGLPALVLRGQSGAYAGVELKTHSSMVACGPVFQPFRSNVKWVGEKVYLPDDQYEKLVKMMWW
jgi:hypothetical protein